MGDSGCEVGVTRTEASTGPRAAVIGAVLVAQLGDAYSDLGQVRQHSYDGLPARALLVRLCQDEP